MPERRVEVGDLAKDVVAGFKGIVVCRTEWLNKCVRVQLQPQELHEGKTITSEGFDEEQVEVLQKHAVTLPKEIPTGGDPDFKPKRWSA